MLGADSIKRGKNTTENKVKPFEDAGTFERDDVGTLFDDAQGFRSCTSGAGRANVLVGKGVALRAGVNLLDGVGQVFRKPLDVAFGARQHVIGETACRLLANPGEACKFSDQRFETFRFNVHGPTCKRR